MSADRSVRDTGATSMAERAYITLRDRLVLLDIAPGEPIDDDEVAKSLGAGRTPVREALKRLETDRLVVSFPRRGTFAAGMDVEDLEHISEIRVELEPLAARRAAERASPATRAQLDELAAQFETLDVSAKGRTELLRWDLTAHRAIYRATSNPHLEDTLIRYHNLATRIHCMFVEELSTVHRYIEEHVDLLRAVVAGEAEDAAELAREHVLGFERAVRALI